MEKMVVSVIVPAYNHGQYIAQSLESAIHQTFEQDYEIIIGDDCSTDHTGEICRRYADHPKIRLISHDQNIGLIQNYRSLFSASRGRYIAILEGDDYWEENKLAEQISFLEAHPECGFLHSNGYFLFENGRRKLIHREAGIPQELSYGDLIKSNRIAAVTACFRRDLLQFADLERFESLGFRTMDYPLWLEFAQHTRMGFLNLPLATYRITAGSISNNRSFEKRRQFEASNRSILEFYSKKYPVAGLNPEFIQTKYNTKLFYAILDCGTFADQKMLSEEYLHLGRIKTLALRCRLIFSLYRVIIRLFYKRV
ncbi:MAG: glycosyltransferase [Bacteroidota bacterium]